MALKIHNRIKMIVLSCSLTLLVTATAFADVLNVRSDAPQTYVVKKGDTLWDISNIFLDKPWLWPELWRNNTQIENPHLIYPGDILRLRYENGVPVLEVVSDKLKVVLTPNVSLHSKPAPIDVLPWDEIQSFVGGDRMMSKEDYAQLPVVYGDRSGTPRFIQTDYVLTEKLAQAGKQDYSIVRRVREVRDSFGKSLGFQIDKIGSAALRVSTINQRDIVEVIHSESEARQGDKVVPSDEEPRNDLRLVAADRQRGELVENVNGNSLIGGRDVVIINLGKRKVSPGMVFGIYEKGRDIEMPDRQAELANSVFDLISFSSTIEQPAYKVGELVVVKTFEESSYAFVTEATTHLRGGEIIAAP